MMTGKLEEALIALGVVVVIALTNYISTKVGNRKAVASTERAVTASRQTLDSVTKNNGGTSVKDSLDRVEDGNRWLDARMDRVVDTLERLAVRQEQTVAKLDEHIEECRNEGN